MQNLALWAVIAAAGALIGTFALFILVLPDRRRPFLSPVLRAVADFLNMRRLMLEAILKAVYVFLNLLMILCGIFALFTVRDGVYIGILMILLGPIVLRILHETIMLRLVTLKTLQEVRNHLRGEDAPPEAVPEEARTPVRRERMSRRQNRPRREDAQETEQRQAGQESGWTDYGASPRTAPAAPQAWPQQGYPYGQQGTRQAYPSSWQQQYPPSYPSGGYGYQDPSRPGQS